MRKKINIAKKQKAKKQEEGKEGKETEKILLQFFFFSVSINLVDERKIKKSQEKMK